MNEYLINLMQQFKACTGIKNIDVNSISFLSEFKDWIGLRQFQGEQYLTLLKCMELEEIKDSHTAEIGKGKHDSIVKDFETTIITPYSNGLLVPKDRIIESEFKVYEDIPVLINETKNGINKVEEIDSLHVSIFMTQNPYTQSKIKNWENLHNSGKGNIVVGVYGNIYDKDRDNKIMQLEELRKKLAKSCKCEYIVNKGTYCYSIASSFKEYEKQKVLTKTR